MLASVSVYYNEKKGYIIVPYAVIKGMGNGGAFSAHYLSSECSTQDVNEAIREMLVLSHTKGSVEREGVQRNQFWKEKGFRSYGPFSKTFQLCSIDIKEKKIKMMKWVIEPGSRGYNPSEISFEMPFELSKLESIDWWKMIARLLKGDSSNRIHPPTQSFLTLDGNNVTFHPLDEDSFDDLDDAHSDLYKAYGYIGDENTYLGFMIDSGYLDFSEQSIFNSWTNYYGELEKYRYGKVADKNYSYAIYACTKTKEFHSYLFPDGDGYLECLFEVNLTLPDSELSLVRKSFEALVDSVDIS